MRGAVRSTTAALLAVAGVGMAATATTAHGTDLRSQRVQDLKSLVLARAADVQRAETAVANLRYDIDQLALQNSDPELRLVQDQIFALKPEVGMRAVTGAGLVVTLNDASTAQSAQLDDIDKQWLLVHQQDIEAVVNALWAGGAEAISVMNERITSESAVRCVGSTVLIHGKVFSPPFVIRAIGDPKKLKRALNADQNVDYFRGLAETFGLTYEVSSQPSIYIPAYTGSVAVHYAQSASSK